MAKKRGKKPNTRVQELIAALRADFDTAVEVWLRLRALPDPTTAELVHLDATSNQIKLTCNYLGAICGSEPTRHEATGYGLDSHGWRFSLNMTSNEIVCVREELRRDSPATSTEGGVS